MKIYAASSWRNFQHDWTVDYLRKLGYEVYDFKNPTPDDAGFSWDWIDPEWHTSQSADRSRALLAHPVAVDAYRRDKDALDWADALVLTLPCGRSAHLELGYAVGKGKFTAILMDDKCGPDLMYSMVGALCLDFDELAFALADSARPTA